MTRRIFRESALSRYNERLEKIELPRFASLPWTLLIWVGGLLLLLFAALLLAAQLPVYIDGPGVVVEADAGAEDAAVTAFLPFEAAPRLRPGQTAQIILVGLTGDEGDAAAISAAVTAVEPEPLSPAAAREQYNLNAAAASLVNGPVIVANIDLDRPLELWAGAVAEVRVEVGTRSILASLPGVGRLFANEPAFENSGEESHE